MKHFYVFVGCHLKNIFDSHGSRREMQKPLYHLIMMMAAMLMAAPPAQAADTYFQSGRTYSNPMVVL